MAMRKRKVITALTLIVLLAALYIGAGKALAIATRRALDAATQSGRQGLVLTRGDVEAVRYVPLCGASWRNLQLHFADSRSFDSESAARADTRIADVRVRLADIRTRTIEMVAKDLVVEWTSVIPEAGAEGGRRRLQGAHASALFSLDAWSARSAKSLLTTLGDDLSGLFREGHCSTLLRFDGKTTFEIGGQSFEAGVSVFTENGVSVLRMNPADILAIAGKVDQDEPLTETEVALLSAHPLEAPRLLTVKNAARATSASAFARDPTVPEDAYRHVLWSYLLTRAYGKEFAQKVTDAHEEGATGNTPADKRMDLNNNAVGRRYAERELPPARILERLQSDADVIRIAAVADNDPH